MSDSMNEGPEEGLSDWRRLLTASQRARMLEDIARVSLAAGTQRYANQPWSDLDVSAGSVAARKSPIERLGFIERILPLLTQAVSQIERDPLSDAVLQPRPVSPPHRARRVSTQALLQAVRRGPDLRTVQETVTTLSPHTPENHAVQSFLQVLAQDSAAIARIAEAAEEPEAKARAAECVRRLRGLLLVPLWAEAAMDRAAWTKLPTLRASHRPEYARVFREMARYRAGFRFDWDHPWLRLPPRETWRLYEIWCLFATLEALLTLGYVPTAEAQTGTPGLFTVRDQRLTFTLAAGTAGSVALRSAEGRRLSLVYNQTFAEGRHSLSHTMQPDITLAGEEKVWILDAKFKAYTLPGEEGGDINQMHAYRDGIVDGAGRRVVACAWCLYAGQADGPNRSHFTYGRSEEAAVGALCLRPGEDALRPLQALLTGWLRKGPPTLARPGFPGT